ncbi:MAG: methyltransferase domain-containing protein [Pseudomonadota bacterium]
MMEDRLDAAIGKHRKGDLDDAEAAYTAILADNPNDHRTLSVAAILDHQRGRVKLAIDKLTKAIAKAPEEAGYHNNLGNIYRGEAEPERALGCYRTALTLEPGNVETLCNVGSLCRRLGLTDEAREALETGRDLAPQHPETNHNLALVYAALNMRDEAMDCIEACHAEGVEHTIAATYHARILAYYGRSERAIEILERSLLEMPDDPEIAYGLQAIRGDVPDRAPDAYVKKHFDGFAEGFDEQLEALKYKAPELLGDLARALVGDDKLRLVLDLGCGTGLMGPHLRPLCETLIGFDLSPRMLKYAEKRGDYDKLGEVELTEALVRFPKGAVDFAVASDTLCYFGALEEVFAGLAGALRPRGAFIGTVEAHGAEEGGDGPRSLESGRYSHSEAYLRRSAEGQGLALRIVKQADLRVEFNEPVAGLIFALENVGLT